MNLFPGLTKAAGLLDPSYDAFEKSIKAPKHGPSNVRYLSAGRAVSKARRRKVAEKRKANAAYRRRWMANNIATSRLRGQLEALDKARVEKFTGHDYAERVDGIVDDLTVKYGSVDEAYSAYAAIVAEQAA